MMEINIEKVRTAEKQEETIVAANSFRFLYGEENHDRTVLCKKIPINSMIIHK